ncbi:MAG: hypothetical protein H7Y04_04495 [Verrucomicrobia bacterium]|nr:hypothetical protein [Cytophagales bacterium]
MLKKNTMLTNHDINDILRETFNKQSQKYKQLIDKQLDKIADDTSQIRTIVLISGGVLLATYLIAKSFGRKQQTQAEMPVNQQLPVVANLHAPNRWTALFWESIRMFVLAIAREKLQDFVNKQAQTKSAASDK